MYNPSPQIIKPLYQLTHNDHLTSSITIDIPSYDLMYRRDANKAVFISRFKLEIAISDSPQGKRILHSEQSFTDSLWFDEQKIISRTHSFSLTTGRMYWIQVKFTDLNSRSSTQTVMPLDKSSRFSPAFFTLKDVSENQVMTFPFVGQVNRDMELMHTAGATATLKITRFKTHYDFPPAPYVITSPIDDDIPYPDSTFTLTLRSGKALLSFPTDGLYRLTDMNNPSSGFPIIIANQGHLEPSAGDMLLYPLRYLSSADEFRNMVAMAYPELAAERFWTHITGNPDRAATVMQRYNTRVMEANHFFIADKPGWLTDRGLIYIIFGPPDRAYIRNDRENWYYNEKLNNPPTEFVFMKTVNPLGIIQYSLVRNTSYRSVWNNAIDRWRR
jgi:GWxTD domain-containing protein